VTALPAANVPPRWRTPLLLLGFVALVAGIGAGLARFGWSMPDALAAGSAWHGPLLLCGFFGTVVALERAVAIGQAWAYVAPLAAGAGAIALVLGAFDAAAWLHAGAGGVLLAASMVIARRQPASFTVLLALAAACWLAGSAIWLAGAALAVVVPWWFGFLVLTIAAERLELSRFMPPSRVAARVFFVIVAVLLAGFVLGADRSGRVLSGLALIALALWLLRQDLARRTIRARGLTRYIAACLLAGYAWLAVSGVLVTGWDGWMPASPARDAALHALGLGFVFSMVFGHAAIIVPAVLRVQLPYHPLFYLPLALLHGSLVLRVVGDAVSYTFARIGAAGNAIALALFIATMLAAVMRGRMMKARATT
jgi:hypothetical protein